MSNVYQQHAERVARIRPVLERAGASRASPVPLAALVAELGESVRSELCLLAATGAIHGSDSRGYWHDRSSGSGRR